MKRNLRSLILTLLFLVLLTGGLWFDKGSILGKDASYTTFYDFVLNANYATWQSGAGTLPFPGSDTDSRGFALWRVNYYMENNLKYPKTLETHPEWKPNGWIKGTYPFITIPDNAKLFLKIGFLKGAGKSDGVRYTVYFNYIGKPFKIFDYYKRYTGSLYSTYIDLSNFSNKKGNFILKVETGGKSSAQDWACWIEAKIIYEKAQPDLIITDFWNESGVIKYRVKNIGNAPTSGYTTPTPFTNKLYIDGREVASDIIYQGLNPNQEIESYFKNYTYPLPTKTETLRVCADTSNSISENNETNNCKEKTFSPQYGGIKVDTGCPNVKVEIYNDKNDLVKTGYSDDKRMYSTGLTLLPGVYRVVPSKEGCEFDPSERIVNVSPNQLVGVYFTCSCKEGPDLVITEIPRLPNEAYINYKIKNNGDESTSSYFKNALYIDGKLIAEDEVNVYIKPGEEIMRKFITPSPYTPTPPDDTIKVCADYKYNVDESDESNNCLEVVWKLPDLTVTDVNCDFDSGKVGYTIENIGEYKTEKSFDVVLFVEGKTKEVKTLDITLNPGDTYTDSFDNYTLPCASLNIKVYVDFNNSIVEMDEGNNSKAVLCECEEDTTPPKITKGPLVDKITETSVVIYWETDEEADSAVLYGINSGALGNREYDSNFASNHTVILNNLLPGTLYEFKVESKDRAGNSVQSRVKFFRTLPEEDKNKPSLYITLPPKLKGNVKLAPLVSDDKGVSRVSLFIDDKLFMTDYTFPYEFIINTKGFDDGLHRFEIRAWDFSGNVVFQGLESFIENTLFDHPTVRIISPSENERIYISTDEEVDIIAEIDHTGDLDIDRIEVLIDDNVVYTEQGRTLCSSSFEEGLSHCVYFPWSCNGSLPTNFVYQLRANLIVTGGEHKIKVIAYDTEGYYGSDEINVVSYVPEWVRPVLIPVYRYEFNPQGTYIHAEVSVYNAGNWPAKDIYLIIDQPMSPGFIITNSSERMQSTLIFGTDCTFHQQVVVTKDNLDTRATWRLSFDLIPIMTENPSSDSYIFINNLTVRYNWEGNEGTTGDYTIHPREDLTNIVQYLTGNSRYLIITNFEDMFDAPSSSSDGFCYATYTGEEGELVTSIGELALLRRGVVGNVRRGTTNTTIKNLISPSGEWARRLSQSFTSPLQGYVLIVGESNIVPSWTITGLNVQWVGGATTPQVDLSDLKYADISDDDLPDLVVGRIIGDNIEDLNRLIMTDIEVAKNMNRITGTKALILAGSEDTMKNAVDDLQSDLSSMYADIVKLNYSDYDNKSDRIDAFLDNTRDRSLIVYDGHGSVSSWQFYNTVSPDPDFGNKNPVIFSFACTTGRYRESNQNLFSLGEKFFNSNASLFIGSTESSAVSLNNEATINFFENYFDLGNLSVGEMLTNYKRDMDIKSKYRKLWVLEYNLYGDPLLGKSSPATLMVIGESGDEDLGEETEINLPNYNKTKKGEFDYIDIPKGSVSTATDKPRVPIFIYKKDIKKGVIVQNVYLKERNKVIEESGVNLPVVEMRPAQYSTLSNKIELNSSNSWYPEEDFRWTFTKNPDGTGTLKIVIFPLFYNQSEKKIRYYKYYKFSIEWIESGITVEDLKVKNRVNLNEEALMSFKVKNSREEKDIVIKAVVEKEGSGEVVDNLKLYYLPQFKGTGSFDLKWTPKSVGNYILKVLVMDMDGNILELQNVSITAGMPILNLEEFSLSKVYVDVGDSVDVNIKLKNIGFVPADGVLNVKITRDGEEIIDRFEGFKDLEEGNVLDFKETFEIEKEGRYIVSVKVYKNSECILSSSKSVITDEPPVAALEVKPEKIYKGEIVAFDALSSYDSDGEVVTFLWDFGDGTTGEGVKVKHIYSKDGDYTVKLTILDDKGGKDTFLKKITVHKKEEVKQIVIRLYIGKTYYYVNDELLEMDVAPIIREGRTLLPIRYVAGALGAEVSWNGKEQKVTITFKGTTIELWIGKNTARVNGEYKLIDPSNPNVKPIIIPPGRTMLPIRFIAENLGCRVDWDPKLREVKITYPGG